MSYISLAQYEKSVELIRKQLDIAKQIGDKASESKAYAHLGICFRLLGQYHADKHAVSYREPEYRKADWRQGRRRKILLEPWRLASFSQKVSRSH